MKIPGFLLAAVLFILCGCNGAQVAADAVDNGPQQVSVAERMHLVRAKTIREEAEFSGPVTPLLPTGVHIRTKADLYVEAPGDVPETFCHVARERLLGARGGWAAPEGNILKLNGAYYHEQFGVVLAESEEAKLEKFKEFLGLYGFKFPHTGYVLYLVTRNLTNHERLELIYGVDINMIPKDILRHPPSLEEYMRQRFNEDVHLS